MPHINHSGDGPGMGQKPGYSDVEVQNFASQVRYPDGESGGQVEVSKGFEPTEHGLDNNEVAELIGFDRLIVLEDPNTGNQTEETSVSVEYAMGADLGGDANLDPFLVNLAGDGTEFPADTSEFNIEPQQNLIYEDDDAAQLDFTRLTYSGTFSSTVEGISGVGSLPRERREVNYRDLYEHGPVFDRTDDVSIGIEIDADDTTASGMFVDHYLQLRWMVYEVDGYRAEFDFPSMS